MAEITTFHLERYKVQRLDQPTARGNLPANVTVNHELKVLSRAFVLAIDQGLADVNPCRRVRHLREEPGRIRNLSLEEQERLMAVLVGELTYLRTIVTIALLTGMRQGEIYSLRWEQVDFGRSTITLTRTKGSPGFRALCFCTCLGSSTARSLLRTRLTALSSLAFEY
jgi:integrase